MPEVLPPVEVLRPVDVSAPVDKSSPVDVLPAVSLVVVDSGTVVVELLPEGVGCITDVEKLVVSASCEVVPTSMVEPPPQPKAKIQRTK